MGLNVLEAVCDSVINILENSVHEIEKSLSTINSRIQNIVRNVIAAIEESALFAAQIGSLFISRQVLSGLAKLTGYEILLHGTSLSSYLSILQNGADPSRGGEATEAGNLDKQDRHLIEDARRKFFVLKDSKIVDGSRDSVVLSLGPLFLPAIIPNIHGTFAYVKEYKKQNSLKPTDQVPLWVWVGSAIASLFTPKVRFIYSLEEIHGTNGRDAIFENDPWYYDAAYQTSEALPNDRIGLVGLVKHVKKEHVFKHIQENPGRAVLGVAQVACGVFLTATGLGILL